MKNLTKIIICLCIFAGIAVLSQDAYGRNADKMNDNITDSEKLSADGDGDKGVKKSGLSTVPDRGKGGAAEEKVVVGTKDYRYTADKDCGHSTDVRTMCEDGKWSDWNKDCNVCGVNECMNASGVCEKEPKIPCKGNIYGADGGYLTATWECIKGKGWSNLDDWTGNCTCGAKARFVPGYNVCAEIVDYKRCFPVRDNIVYENGKAVKIDYSLEACKNYITKIQNGEGTHSDYFEGSIAGALNAISKPSGYVNGNSVNTYENLTYEICAARFANTGGWNTSYGTTMYFDNRGNYEVNCEPNSGSKKGYQVCVSWKECGGCTGYHGVEKHPGFVNHNVVGYNFEGNSTPYSDANYHYQLHSK